MNISVIACTYNRCDSVRDTIIALKRQRMPVELQMEIIIVDNNSKDQTKKVVEAEMPGSLYPIHYVFESMQGVNHARNAGLRNAKGELIFFTDDDVEPNPDWAHELWKGFQQFNPDFAGGPIYPKWLRTPPNWLLDKDFHGHLAMLDRGSESFVTKEVDPNFIYGANMAFKRKLFDECGLFRVDIGVKGDKSLARGDDSEMVQRAFLAGKAAAYIPTARVHHKVQPERMTHSYLRRWRYNGGKSYVRMRNNEYKGIPKWLLREWLMNGWATLLHFVKRNRKLAMQHEEKFWAQLGMMVELWGTKNAKS